MYVPTYVHVRSVVHVRTERSAIFVKGPLAGSAPLPRTASRPRSLFKSPGALNHHTRPYILLVRLSTHQYCPRPAICTMASSEIIVIDDSSDDEAPRPTAAAAAASGGEASSKRARVDPTSTPADVPAIITPSFAGASTAASANNAHSAASATFAASTQSPVTGGGVATTSAKKRPSPTLGQEARLLDPALQRADGHGGTSKSSKEETLELSDPRHTLVDILGNCHAKVSFGAGRSPMPPNAIMGLPGLSVNGVGPVSIHETRGNNAALSS